MPRPWAYAIDLDRASALPPFLQIARTIAGDIQRGRLKPGDRLPGSRTLAASIGVHRNTVLAALAELTAEGWIEASPARATCVSRQLPDRRARPFSRTVAVRTRVPLQIPFTLPEAPAPYRPPMLPHGTLDLSSGSPDVRLAPVRAIGRAYRRVLARQSRVLAYGDPEGHPRLRSSIAHMLASTRGLAVTADDLVITRGSQMALTLVARTLLRPGDVVAVEELGYRPAWEAFRSAGATVVPVAVDREGLDVDALTQLARRTTLRAVYVTPHHQYPTTVTLKAARRLALLSLARTCRFAIVEDDYDHEFHYDGRPVLPLASADDAGAVIYVGTLSKVLAPGLRLGYLVAPRPVLRNVTAIRSVLDIQGDLATEAAVAGLMEDGELQRHIARVRRVYASRRDVLASSLRKTFGDRAAFTMPSGGMALWVRLRVAADVDAWARRSADRGVSWHTGRRYAFDGQSRPFARFSFTWLDERELSEAVARLADALRPAAPSGGRYRGHPARGRAGFSHPPARRR